MRKILMLLVTVLITSCEAPKEIIKSAELIPTCHCEGNGNHTIVMDAGMGNWSLFYQPLFQKLKNTNRVCIIDRPGYSMEAVTTHPRDLITVANELHQVISEAAINSKIILVGHSLGGLHVRQYQVLFPENVKGMVLLDAASSNQFEKLPKAFYEILKTQPKNLKEIIAIAQKGYLKYTKGQIPTFGLPKDLLEKYYAVTTTPAYYYTMKMEVEAFEANLKAAKKLNQLEDLPLLVIGSKNNMDKKTLPIDDENYPFEEHNAIWFTLQEELANLSSNSTFVVSEKNHYLNVTDTDLIQDALELWMKKNFEDGK